VAARATVLRAILVCLHVFPDEFEISLEEPGEEWSR